MQLVAAALLEDDAAGPAWQSKHKAGLRGSSRILAALDAGHPSTTMQVCLLPRPDARPHTAEISLLNDLIVRATWI